MPNYNQQSIDGTVTDYQRSNKVIVINELNEIPEITFMEQIVTSLPDSRKIITGTTKCSDKMIDPTEAFNLLNPEDDSVIGMSNYQGAYILLYSLYRYVASKRDTTL